MATIKDVAHKAGLSVTTVSRYLNNHPYISDEKKEKIRDAMEELDYVPSSLATQLRSNRGTMIGVLVSRLTNPYFAYLVDAIEKKAKQQGYRLLIMQTYGDKQEEINTLEMLKEKTISGLIMCAVENDLETVESYAKYGAIAVSTQTDYKSDRLRLITTNQEQATYDAINFLIRKGYTGIAYSTGGDFTDQSHGSYRNKGYLRALEESDIKLNERWIFKNNHTIEDGMEIAVQLSRLNEKDRPDAIFAGSDEVAIGIIRKFEQLNIRVPADIAVMGFDNQPFSSLAKIPLTTVGQPMETLGQQAASLIISMIEGTEFAIDESQLKLKIIERESA
ncbi:substrate-binding domain-containing protein [Salinicoccus hispanicus]|uniref:Substrate-binding domain-containing protein n=1 Tax=Salinicoccus hispanicus TaxID=157225 RepID=A0A6N8TZP7_9STAP|nr:substrate-binding domain-containing protein [Salinicoccus hispanicus]